MTKEDIKNEEPASVQGSDEAMEVKKELEDAKAKCEEYLNGWKRERADFLNYKKDEMERIGQLAKYANEELILKIIPILDNIYLAEKYLAEARHLQASATDAGLLQNDKWVQGFLQIKDQLENFLKKEGIEAIKTLYEKFDPNYMEVVEEVPAREASHDKEGWKAEEPGIVVEETQKGYTMHGKIIRVAKVKISK